jgi:hypothetical protein
MLSKCANPSCSTPLVYLREGKIFMMENPMGLQAVDNQDQGKSSSSPRVEHYWLCGPCSTEMTLVYDRKLGVQVLPKSASRRAQVAS